MNSFHADVIQEGKENSGDYVVNVRPNHWWRGVHVVGVGSVTWRWSSRCLRWWWRRRRRWWWWRCNWGPNWGLPKSEAKLKTKIEKNEDETQKTLFFGNITVFSEWWTEILHWQNIMPFLVILLVVCLAQDGIKVALFFHRVSLQHLIIVLSNFSIEVIVNYLKIIWLKFV